MRFVVLSFMYGTVGLMRSYKNSQLPEIDQEYVTDEYGHVIGKYARVIYDEENGYTWYPCATSYSSYHFTSTPIHIEIKKCFENS